MKNCRLPIADCRLAVARKRTGLSRRGSNPPAAGAPVIRFNRQSTIGNWQFGFTLIEVLTVMTVILILAGITIGTYSYVNNRGARARAEGEIAALGAACENYKLDNGDYPRGDADALDARQRINPTQDDYQKASKALYDALHGPGTSSPNAKSYFSFRPVMLGKRGSGQPAPAGTQPDFIRDPWGYSYGYSTIRQVDTSGSRGFNPTFDLWSTAGNTTDQRPKWVRNW